MGDVTEEHKTLLRVFLGGCHGLKPQQRITDFFPFRWFFFGETLNKNQYLIKAIFLFPDYCSRKQTSKGHFDQRPAGGV